MVAVGDFRDAYIIQVLLLLAAGVPGKGSNLAVSAAAVVVASVVLHLAMVELLWVILWVILRVILWVILLVILWGA